MTRPVWRRILGLFLPEGLILLATVLLVRMDSLHDTLVSLSTFYPAAVFATAVFLAMRFRRGRLMFSLVALALAAWGPLAAGTANSIHLDGPGRIYIAGPNADFLDLRLLEGYLQEMVKMSPLQGSYFQIVPTSQDMALIGAAVASRAK